MFDRKRLVSFGVTVLVFSTAYALLTWRMGSAPGLFVPTALLMTSWFVGQVVAESLYLKDEMKWRRSAATVGAMLAAGVGLGFLVILRHDFHPVHLLSHGLTEAAFGFGAVYLGLSMPRK